MDGARAIRQNSQALRRILAGLLAMVGLAGNAPAATLPRHLYLAVLRLVRPAESAARRLVIAMARGIVVPAPKSVLQYRLNGARGIPGKTLGLAGLAPVTSRARGASPRPLGFPLLDKLRTPFPHPPRRAPVSTPRVWCLGMDRRPLPVPAPRLPGDPILIARLNQRLQALGRTLDDLPAAARRFARWRARSEAGLVRRRWPLRPGRPPGGRLSAYDPTAPRRRNIREVDAVLAHAHALAVYALERRDTS